MKLMPAPLNLAIAFVALALTLPAHAQASAQGRALFKHKNCALCHFYEARSIAPSVKKMKSGLKGDPARTSAAISAAPGHANELGSVTAADIRAISEWLAETTFDEQAAAQAAAPKPGSPELESLTAREHEILKHLADGLQYKEIAEQLRISTSTVRAHLHTIYGKLHVQSRTEAVVKDLKR